MSRSTGGAVLGSLRLSGGVAGLLPWLGYDGRVRGEEWMGWALLFVGVGLSKP